MMVIVTYDENGGFWDHVAPPKGDRWGPGTRIPAIIVSPLVRLAVIQISARPEGTVRTFVRTFVESHAKRRVAPRLPRSGFKDLRFLVRTASP